MSVSNAIVAARYADALMGIVGDDMARLDRLDDELDMIGDLLESDPKFASFLANPRVLTKEKKGVIQRALGEKLSKETIHLILVLIDKHRETELFAIARRFSRLADLKRGVEQAEVITAVPLPPAQLERLTAKVQQFSTHKVKLVAKVDPSILGGVVLKLGTQVIDGSVRYKLDDLRRSLLATTVH